VTGLPLYVDLLQAASSLGHLIDPDVAATVRAVNRDVDELTLAGACLGVGTEAVDALVAARLLPDLLTDDQQADLSRRLRVPVEGLDRGIRADRETTAAFLGFPVPRADAEVPIPTSAHPEYPLFPHQRRGLEDIQKLLAAGHTRVLLHMPTGAGKTRTAMNLVCDRLRASERGAVLWLASTKELLAQGALEFARAWGHLGNRDAPIHTAWGGREWDANDVNDGLIVASPQTLQHLLKAGGPAAVGALGDRLQLIVFDEAHQAIARTYRDITERLAASRIPVVPIVGLTATPGRTFAGSDGDDALVEFFRNKVTLDTSAQGGPSNPVDYLIEHGYLAQPTFTLLGDLPDEGEEVDPFVVEDEVDLGLSTREYLEAVLAATLDLTEAGHTRAIVFAASVELAGTVAAALRGCGVRASSLHAGTESAVRDTIIREYKTRSRDPRVIVNYGVLTTGFDAPQTSAAVIARPTRSLVLYSQMVGRAIRGTMAGGNAEAEVVTVVDPTVPAFGNIASAFRHWDTYWGEHV
jgi:DNA repair protein RadD